MSFSFAVLGPTQFGKSSFINCVGSQALPVGNNDGQSCTAHVAALSIPDTLGLFGAGTQAKCLDVPGFNDTSGVLSDKTIVEEVKLGLAGFGYKQLDALFVFQSLAESAFQLQKCLQVTETLFGPTILRSIVVIATKSDLLPEQVLAKRIETINSIVQKKNLLVVLWVNDSEENGCVPDEKKREQATQLRAAISRLQAYEITDMQEFASKVQVRAETMMRGDLSNVVQQSVTVPYDVLVKYEEDETYAVPVTQRKYPEAKVIEEARRLQALKANKEPYEVTREEKETVTVPETYNDTQKVIHWESTLFIPWRWSDYVTVQKVRYVRKQITKTVKEVAYRDRPLEHFAAPLRLEMVSTTEQKVRKVQKQKSERRTKTEIVTSYRRDWTQYRMQAAKELIVG